MGRSVCERWIAFQASTSVLRLHYRPVTVHCSTKHAYTSARAGDWINFLIFKFFKIIENIKILNSLLYIQIMYLRSLKIRWSKN